MNTRKLVIRAVLVVIGLPVVSVLIAVVSFYVLFYAPNRSNGTIVSSGQNREYLLYVPMSYDRTKPTPLVISMHAAALWPATQMETSQWNEVADEHGFIVVYPSGTTLDGSGTGVRPKVWSIKAGSGCGGKCPIHLGLDRHAGGGLQHRPVPDLCKWVLQWGSHDLCAVLQAIPSNCRGRNRCGCSRPTAV